MSNRKDARKNSRVGRSTVSKPLGPHSEIQGYRMNFTLKSLTANGKQSSQLQLNVQIRLIRANLQGISTSTYLPITEHGLSFNLAEKYLPSTEKQVGVLSTQLEVTISL